MVLFGSCMAIPLLYGMTQSGGANGKGNIFKVYSNGTGYSNLYSFNTATGYGPLGSLSQSFSNSRLYGMTQFGGANNAGVLFSFDPVDSLYTDIHDFNTTDGSTPTGNVLQASNGLIYGMTQAGGNAGFGVLFSLDPTTNAYNVIINFSGTNGSYPMGSLLQASNGLLYGMTKQGGSNNFGTIFTFNTATNILTTIVSFTGNNGAHPGSNPYGSLIQMGNSTIFGMTRLGGTGNAGVIFSIDATTNAYSLAYQFNTFSNHYPNGNLTVGPNGLLYGMTTGGGNLSGSIFQFDPTINILGTIITFGLGEHPKGNFILAGNGLFYCMIDSGGTTGNGKLLMFDPGNNTSATVLNFDGTNGAHPWGDLVIPRCPIVNFRADTNTFCQPLHTQFTNLTTYSNSFLWDFGDGNTDTSANPSHTYGFASIDTVTLTANNLEGCVNTVKRVYHFVDHPTQALFTADTLRGCPTLTVQFTNQSQYATSYIWYYGDGYQGTAVNPIHNYTATAFYDVRLYAYDSINGCNDTLIMRNYIQVYQTAPVAASFTMNPTTGCTPLNIDFTNTSSNTATSFVWYFGDGDSSYIANPSHLYLIGDSLFPKVVAYNTDTSYHCIGKSIFYDTLVTHYPAHSSFIADSTGGCLPMSVQFINSSTNAISYLWKFGNGDTSTAANPVYTYTNAGIYTDTLIANGGGGCNDTLIRTNYLTAQTRPIIIPSFSGSPLTGCDSLTVQFSNTTTDATFYLWRFGDGGSNSINNPSYHYTHPGNYSVTLIAYNYALCGLLSDTLILFNYIHVLTPPNIIITQSGDTLISNLTTGNQWYDYGSPIVGATAQKYVVPGTGCYQAMNTDTSGCSNLSNVICINFAGIPELENNAGISVYPNPFNEKTTLAIQESSIPQNATLKITDLMGQQVRHIFIPFGNSTGKREITIDRQNLPSGMYFFQLILDDATVKFGGKLLIAD